jgi:phosphomannomutase
MTSYLFDIDGTLTEPRQMMIPVFESWFYRWMKLKKVYLVTGSDMSKVREQVSERIIDNCQGVFCSMANELYVDDELVYQNKLNLPPELEFWLQEQFQKSLYPVKRGNNFEYRPGMLNFSIAGRESTVEERNAYYEWDKNNKERQRIADSINLNYRGEAEACVGGQISIDIQNTGNNKSLASKWLRKNDPGNLLFFGDKTDVGGNDHAIVLDINIHNDGRCFKVEGPEQLKKMLMEL